MTHGDMRLLNAYHVLMDGLYDSVAILLPFLALSFGGAEKQAGVILSLAVAASTLAGLSSVALSRRLGFFRTLSAILLLTAVGYLGCALADGPASAGIAVMFALIGAGVFHNLAFSRIARTTPGPALGKAMGDFTAIGDMGRIPFASLAGILAAMPFFSLPGWRFVCLAYACVALVAAGLLFRRNDGPAPSPEPVQNQAPAKTRLPRFALLRDRQLARPVLSSVLDACASDQIFAFLPFLLLAKGIDPKILGSFAFAFTLGCFLGKKACGRLVDVLGARPVFALSEVAMAGLLLVLLLSEQLSVIVCASLLLGVVTKGTVPVVQAILAEQARPSGRYDDVFSINSFLRGIAGILTPLVFGLAASALGPAFAYGLMALFALLAVVPLALGRGGAGRG